MDFSLRPTVLFQIVHTSNYKNIDQAYALKYLSESEYLNTKIINGYTIHCSDLERQNLMSRLSPTYNPEQTKIIQSILIYGHSSLIRYVFANITNLPKWKLPFPLYLSDQEFAQLIRDPNIAEYYFPGDLNLVDVDYLTKLMLETDSSTFDVSAALEKIIMVDNKEPLYPRIEFIVPNLTRWTSIRTFLLAIMNDADLQRLPIVSPHHKFPTTFWYVLMFKPELTATLSKSQIMALHQYFINTIFNSQFATIDFTAACLLQNIERYLSEVYIEELSHPIFQAYLAKVDYLTASDSDSEIIYFMATVYRELIGLCNLIRPVPVISEQLKAIIQNEMPSRFQNNFGAIFNTYFNLRYFFVNTVGIRDDQHLSSLNDIHSTYQVVKRQMRSGRSRPRKSDTLFDIAVENLHVFFFTNDGLSEPTKNYIILYDLIFGYNNGILNNIITGNYYKIIVFYLQYYFNAKRILNHIFLYALEYDRADLINYIANIRKENQPSDEKFVSKYEVFLHEKRWFLTNSLDYLQLDNESKEFMTRQMRELSSRIERRNPYNASLIYEIKNFNSQELKILAKTLDLFSDEMIDDIQILTPEFLDALIRKFYYGSTYTRHFITEIINQILNFKNSRLDFFQWVAQYNQEPHNLRASLLWFVREPPFNIRDMAQNLLFNNQEDLTDSKDLHLLISMLIQEDFTTSNTVFNTISILNENIVKRFDTRRALNNILDDIIRVLISRQFTFEKRLDVENNTINYLLDLYQNIPNNLIVGLYNKYPSIRLFDELYNRSLFTRLTGITYDQYVRLTINLDLEQFIIHMNNVLQQGINFYLSPRILNTLFEPYALKVTNGLLRSSRTIEIAKYHRPDIIRSIVTTVNENIGAMAKISLDQFLGIFFALIPQINAYENDITLRFEDRATFNPIINEYYSIVEDCFEFDYQTTIHDTNNFRSESYLTALFFISILDVDIENYQRLIKYFRIPETTYMEIIISALVESLFASYNFSDQLNLLILDRLIGPVIPRNRISYNLTTPNTKARINLSPYDDQFRRLLQ